MRRGARCGGWAALPIVATALVAVLPSASASFTATATAAGSAATAAMDAPTVDTTDTVVQVPLVSCLATTQWSAPQTAVTGYEVRRVRGGAVVGGPWSVTADVLEHVDANVPLTSLLLPYTWEVRGVHGTWRSPWAVAGQVDLTGCLL